jgi:hypothetical protein
MKRFLIFSVLFPPLALLVFIAPDVMARGEFPEVGLVLGLLGLAYLFTLVPAWAAAAADWVLSEKPFYLRFVTTIVVAAVVALLTACYLGEREQIAKVVLMGAIPAAVCSPLSHPNMKSRAVREG